MQATNSEHDYVNGSSEVLSGLRVVAPVLRQFADLIQDIGFLTSGHPGVAEEEGSRQLGGAQAYQAPGRQRGGWARGRQLEEAIQRLSQNQEHLELLRAVLCAGERCLLLCWQCTANLQPTTAHSSLIIIFEGRPIAKASENNAKTCQQQ
jgi:hypothetical protein